MAVQMYRKGSQHEINGHMVDIMNVTDIHGALQLGWCLTIADAFKDDEDVFGLQVEDRHEEIIPEKKRPGRPKKRAPKIN